MYPHITRTHTLLDGTSANSSTYTSNALLVADYRTQALSWATVTGSASTLTVQGTLIDGSQAAIAEGDWSNLSFVRATGQFAVDAGSRYLRVVRGANDSQSSVIFNGIY